MILSSYLVAQKGLPWQVMMYISAFMIICMLVAFQVIIRNHKEDMALIQPTVVDEKDNEAVKEKVPFKKLFAPHMLFAYILYFGTCYAYYMIVTWLPNFLSTERGFQGAAIGLSSSLVAFASIPGALFFSRLADKYMHKKSSIHRCFRIFSNSHAFVNCTSK